PANSHRIRPGKHTRIQFFPSHSCPQHPTDASAHTIKWFPAGLAPLPTPEAANNTIADYMSSSTSEPLVQTASLSLEHGFGSILLTGGLLYSRGKNVLVGNSAADPDAIPLSALAYGVQLNNIAFSQSLREYPQFIDFNLNNLYPIGRYVREASYLHA